MTPTTLKQSATTIIVIAIGVTIGLLLAAKLR